MARALLSPSSTPTPLRTPDGRRQSAMPRIMPLPKLKSGVNFSQIIPLGIYDVSPAEACGPYGWWEEQSLDMVAVHGAAPGADIVFVGSAGLRHFARHRVLQHGLQPCCRRRHRQLGCNNGESIAPVDRRPCTTRAAMAGACAGHDGASFQFRRRRRLGGAQRSRVGILARHQRLGHGCRRHLAQDHGRERSEIRIRLGTYRALLADVTVHSAASVTTSGVTTTTAFGETFDAYAFYAGAGGGISLLESQPSYQAAAVPAVLADGGQLSQAASPRRFLRRSA